MSPLEVFRRLQGELAGTSMLVVAPAFDSLINAARSWDWQGISAELDAGEATVEDYAPAFKQLARILDAFTRSTS